MTRNYKLMTHIVAGYPSLAESEQIAETMLETGVDFIEIQIPFSDPIGDGPTITEACRDAIDAGIKVEDCFNLMEKVQKKAQIPLLFMTYYNIIFNYGVEDFCKKCADLNVYGLIVPDMPFDEEKEEHFLENCQKYDLKPIQIVSPITPEERLKKIGEMAEGFVYCVAGFGTTGTKQNKMEDVESYLTRVRKYVKVPISLGFGISSKEEIQEAGKVADIVVIGSQIIKMYQRDKDLEKIKELLII